MMNMLMNLNIRRSILTGKWAIGIASTLAIAAFAILLLWKANRASRLVQKVDLQMELAYETYTTGTFGAATNEFRKYIGLLEEGEMAIEVYRDVDLLLYIARVKLGYMLLSAGDASSAARELSVAYERYVRRQNNTGVRPVPRSEFVDYVIAGVEKLDANSGAAWKRGALSSNSIRAVKALFER